MEFNIKTKYHFDELWCFVAFAFGIIVYFGLPFEVPLWIWAGLLIVFGSCAFFYKHQAINLTLFLVLGLLVVSVRTSFVRTEFIKYPQWHKEIFGQITAAFTTHTGQVVFLENLKGRLPFLPKRVRLSFRKQEPLLTSGDTITFIGHLYPPQMHQRIRSFYQGIEAYGTISEIVSHHHGFEPFLSKTRNHIMQRLRQSLDESGYEIAVPLVVGAQQVVSRNLYDIYRKAGIAHVLSVSGFHMALLAGFVFFVIRGLLALIPFLSVRINTKKIAAIIALLTTGFYVTISGLQIPALRAFLMISIVFLGILTDRKTISLHTLLLVGFVLLCWRPEWITSISFQLSFCAVLVLVGIFEELARHVPHIKFIHLLATALIANALVSIALIPFIIFHFNQLNPYGIIGNLLTTLLFSFWIMPSLFLGTLLLPFGGEVLFFKAAGVGLNIVTKLATMVANWPKSEIKIPSFSATGLALIALGLCLLCLIKNRYRFLGLAFMVFGIGIGYLTQSTPDVIVSNNGKLVLLLKDGIFHVKGDSRNWMVQRWLQKNGQRTASDWPIGQVDIKGYKIAFQTKDCLQADLAILQHPQSSCSATKIFVPKKHATYYLYLQDDIQIQREDHLFSNRPWGKNLNERITNE